MAEQNGSKVDLKFLALVLSLATAIGSPFIAVGGYKQKIADLERRAYAAENTINTIISTENQKDVQIEGRLARMETILSRIEKAVG